MKNIRRVDSHSMQEFVEKIGACMIRNALTLPAPYGDSKPVHYFVSVVLLYPEGIHN